MIKNWMCTDLLGAERTKDKKYRLYLQCDAFSYTIQSDYLYNKGSYLIHEAVQHNLSNTLGYQLCPAGH